VLQLNDVVTVCFHDAGHILGSAMIEVTVRDEDERKNIVFSGDIGQWNKPLLSDPPFFDSFAEKFLFFSELEINHSFHP
jgi:metallo-beta-lactamase family protein